MAMSANEEHPASRNLAKPTERSAAPAAPVLDGDGAPPPPADAYEAVAHHAKRGALLDLAAEVFARMFAAHAAWPDGALARARAAELGLEREACATPFGNALDVLERGPEDAAERTLAGALCAHAAWRTDPSDDAAPKMAERILWLAAHTPFDALGWIERAEERRRPWAALGAAIRTGGADRGARAVGCAALVAAQDARAHAVASELASSIGDPLLAAMLSQAAVAGAREAFSGAIAPVPRRAWVTVLLGVTGLLLVVTLVRLVLGWALSYETPAQVEVSADAVTVHWRTRLLGRTLRERKVTLPTGGLASVTREVRFPSLFVYVGLIALVAGSTCGLSLLVDGARAASPSLVGVGLGIVLAGVALDFVLGSALPGVRGRCRVLLVPRKGRALCVDGVEPAKADKALARLRGAPGLPT